MNIIRPKPKMLTLTESAATQITKVLEASGKDYIAVRVGVENGGCAGMSYTMSYASERGPHEEVVEDKGVKIFIEPAAIMFLLGTELDYQTDKLSSQFTFKNPNETSACGCGESVSIAPAINAETSKSD